MDRFGVDLSTDRVERENVNIWEMIGKKDREKKSYGPNRGSNPGPLANVLSRSITQSEHRTTRPLGHK
jgi:hypothetical protein